METSAATRCVACGAGTVADLAEEHVVEQLHALDDALPVSMIPGAALLRGIAWGLAAAVTGALAILGAAGFGFAAHAVMGGLAPGKSVAGVAFTSAFLSLFGSYALVAYVVPALRGLRGASRRTPLRWAGCFTRARAARPKIRGRVRPTDDAALLTSPLTGRACVAWEVAVRKDDDPLAPDGTWLLVERRSCRLTVGGTGVPTDRLAADLPRERVRIGDTELSHFARERGLDPTGLSLVVYETIVPEDAVVDLWATKDGRHRLRVVDR